MISIKINDVFKPGTLVTGKRLREAGFSKFYKIMRNNDVHFDMSYETGKNVDVLPFYPHGTCLHGGLYFATIDEIFMYVKHGEYIREVTVDDDEPIYIDEDKMKAHTIYLGDKMPLWCAETLSKLFSESKDTDTYKDLLFCIAAETGHLEAVKFFMSIGVSVHTCYEYAFRWAVNNGHIKVVEFLISAGADINSLNGHAFRTAVQRGYFDIVKLLIKVGANIHVYGDEALQLAAMKGYTKIAELLISHGANVSVLNETQKDRLRM